LTQALLLLDVAPRIYRAKSLVRLRGESYLFNYAAGRMNLEEFPAKKIRLVFCAASLLDERNIRLYATHVSPSSRFSLSSVTRDRIGWVSSGADGAD